MIVLDASAAIAMEQEAPEGQAFAALLLDGEKTISVDLFRVEVANAFWKYCNAGCSSVEAAVAHMNNAYLLVDEYYSIGELCPEVLSEAVRLKHSVYDVFYLVLARQNAATLFTLDKKLQRLCAENGVNCVEIEERF